MEKTNVSQARPMATWCLLVAVLIAVVVAIGVVLFYMPGRGQPVEKRSTSPGSSAQ